MIPTVLKSTLMGAFFGALFPFAASLWIIIQESLPYYTNSFIQVQRDEPLLWMIDTAPLFLGLFAGIAGVRQARIQNLNESLRQRIEEREQLVQQLEEMRKALTQDVNRQIIQMKAVAEVAKEAAAIREVDELLSKTTRLISEHFNFYHTGIFLINNTGDAAVLRAANSSGGRRMLSRGHRLRVGQEGIVGFVAGTGKARIALDVEADADYFDNPEMPETRSEMALPLKVRERSIGVLDVQSKEQNAFTQDDVATLQVLADQIALAIENARLLRDSQKAFQELEAFYGRQVGNAWREKIGTMPLANTYTRATGANQIGETAGSARPGSSVLTVPVILRGQHLGVIKLQRDREQPEWTDRDRQLVDKLSQQIALALENARLLEETYQQAQNEKLIAETTSRMRETLDVETVLQTAAAELRKALNLNEVEVSLGTEGGAAEPESPVHNSRPRTFKSHTPEIGVFDQ